MGSPTGRMIFTSARRGRRELKELLQSIFTAELLFPSEELWLVSPWISNIPVIDDSSGRFRRLNGTGRGSLFLVDILTRLASEGTRVRVVTRPGESEPFLSALQSSKTSSRIGGGELLVVLKRDKLHAKGLAGDGYCLWGSMNLTWSGTSRWEELVEFADGLRAAEIRREFRTEYMSDDS